MYGQILSLSALSHQATTLHHGNLHGQHLDKDLSAIRSFPLFFEMKNQFPNLSINVYFKPPPVTVFAFTILKSVI